MESLKLGELAIKNWDKYQPGRSGKSTWVKDYTDKESDPAYMALTGFQRYILDGCCRLRGKSGRDLPNDPEYVARALQVTSKERHCVPQAIRVLTERGFLVVVNQQVESPLHKSKRREEKSKNREEKPSASAMPRGAISNPAKVSNSVGETRHHRIEQIVRGWYRDWAGVECPWDGGEASQLSRMLKAWPNQPDQQFVTCLDNLARSDCVPKGDRPREWLGKLPKFVQTPLDQYWKPKGISNGNARANERNTQSTAEIDSAVARLSGRAAKENEGEISSTSGGGGFSGLVGRLAKAFPSGGDGSV